MPSSPVVQFKDGRSQSLSPVGPKTVPRPSGAITTDSASFVSKNDNSINGTGSGTAAAEQSSTDQPDIAAKDTESSTSSSSAAGTIDMDTFRQILDLDEDETYEFSAGMVWAYFDQAAATFKDMESALAAKDLSRLSALGHFLKGSSAALGVTKVQASCERMQHCGQRRDEESGVDLSAEEALDKIERLLVQVKREYDDAEKWLKNWYKEHGVDQPEAAD